MDMSEVDDRLIDPAFFAGTEYHDTLAHLRRNDPVHWTTPHSYSRGFWSVTSYADCLRLHEEPENFSSGAGSRLPPEGTDKSEEEKYRMGWDVQLLVSDPPVHEPRRRPFNPHFSVPAAARRMPDCQGIVEDIIASIAGAGRADAVEDIAALLPVRLILSMMAIPEEDWPAMRDIARAIMEPDNPRFGGVDRTDFTRIFVDANDRLYQYLNDHIRERRSHPTDDFASVIANMHYRGEIVGERDATWMAASIVGAGLETTASAGSVGIMELIKRPEQAAQLQDDEVAKSAVEEILRWSTPSKNKLRVATRDLELGGKHVKKGDWVVGWVVSANRDETVFENPDEFDIHRSHNPHLSFGQGEHMCLGRNVARLELRVLFQKLFAALPDMELDGEYQWVESTNTSGLSTLPIKFSPRTPAVG